MPEMTASQTEVEDLLAGMCAGCEEPLSGFPKFRIIGDKHLGIFCVCDNADPAKQGIYSGFCGCSRGGCFHLGGSAAKDRSSL